MKVANWIHGFKPSYDVITASGSKVLVGYRIICQIHLNILSFLHSIAWWIKFKIKLNRAIDEQKRSSNTKIHWRWSQPSPFDHNIDTMIKCKFHRIDFSTRHTTIDYDLTGSARGLQSPNLYLWVYFRINFLCLQGMPSFLSLRVRVASNLLKSPISVSSFATWVSTPLPTPFKNSGIPTFSTYWEGLEKNL